MEDFIYARQSVDKEDSISIESQIELCLREVGNNPHRVFRDKGCLLYTSPSPRD